MATVLLFHHAQGCTDGIDAFADRLRAAGHEVVVPDLFDGHTFDTLDEGFAFAREVIGFDTVAENGVAFAQDQPADVVYAGFSLGIMPAQRLAQQRPGARGLLLYHGGVPVDTFGDAWPDDVPIQAHVMVDDDWGDVDDVRELARVTGGEAFLYDGDDHLFTDHSLDAWDPVATALVVERTLSFLAAVDATAPRVDPEREVLTDMLDTQRAILRWKAGGLDREQMTTTVAASSLHLAGLVKHMTRVEQDWFAWVFEGLVPEEPWRTALYGPDPEPDWEFRSATEDDPEQLLAAYDAACARSRAIVAATPSLDQQAAREMGDWPAPTLRWILAHMIEETARHCGHADLIREAIDGLVGEDPPGPPS